ncbi:TonB-dependent receptor [soil metagenome]
MIVFRTALLMGGCALIALSSSAAHAQALATSGTSAKDEIEEIIVTAQRRSENLQTVPISVSAITASQADALGIKSAQEVTLLTPGLTYAQTNSGANITIRGIGASGSSTDEASNAVYVDGVYQSSAPGLLFGLSNVERVEVAKGPQGTLFGRNSIGGLIQIITRKPSHDPHADLSVSYGNYQTVEASAYVTGGLTDTLAADLSIYNKYQGEGWGTNLFDGSDTFKGKEFSIRSKLLWTPSDRTEVTLTGGYFKLTPAASQGTGILPGEKTLAGTSYAGLYTLNSNAVRMLVPEQTSASLTVRQDLNWAQLVSISAYAKTDLLFASDTDSTPLTISHLLPDNSPNKQFSQELQLLTPSSSTIKGTLGLFYFYNQRALVARGASPGGALRQIDGVQSVNSYAAYGQVTMPVTDSTNVTAGLRYTIDSNSGDVTIGTGTVAGGITSSTVYPHRHDVFKKLTWRLAIDQTLAPGIMAYASYNRGYKSGLYNISTPDNPAVGPEVIDAYEVGFKSQFFDNRVRFNVSAFYYNFDDVQVRTSSVFGTVLLNAASQKSKGIDVDLTVNPLPGMSLFASGSYLDAKYKKFDNAPFAQVNPVTGGLVAGTPFDTPPGGAFQSAAGKTAVFSPKFVGSAGFTQKVEASFGTLNFSGVANYNDGFFFDAQNRVFSRSYTLVNGSIGWTARDGHVSLQLWGKNLAGEKYFTSMLITPPIGDIYTPGPPRTYGVTARYKF